MSHTVLGIFESRSEAQQAVTELMNAGFAQEQIDVSSDAASENQGEIQNVGMGSRNTFFNSLFDDAQEANRYSDVASRGTMITVHAQSNQEAQRAAVILDQYGTVDVNQRTSFDTSSNLGESANLSNETSIPVVEENLTVGKREVETGGVRLRSRIIERPVEEHLRLREEHVFVERNPVNRAATESDFNTFAEKEIELREHQEVPVVNKQAQVVEEITLHKEVEERTETISDSVRRTEVEIDNLGSGNVETESIGTQQGTMAFASDENRGGDYLDRDHEKQLLKRMKELEADYKVAEEDADVRGWNVITGNNEKIGEVDEMIVDTEAMKVRYLDVEVENSSLNTQDRHILIPIGSATVDKDNKNILVNNLSAQTLANYPKYNGTSISRNYEEQVRSALSPDFRAGSVSEDKFYEGEFFNSDNFNGNKF